MASAELMDYGTFLVASEAGEPRGEPSAHTLTSSVYQRRVRQVLATHTAEFDSEYLPIAACHDLAVKIQENASEDQRLAARNTLVESHLPLAAHLARLSMGILPRKVVYIDGLRTIVEETKPAFRFRGNAPMWMVHDITTLASPYAVLDDRTQVANEALLHAAETFIPGTLNRAGELLSFTGWAAVTIKSRLAAHVENGRELPGAGTITTTEVKQDLRQLWRSDTDLSPAQRQELLEIHERRHTVPLEALRLEGANSEEQAHPDDDPALLHIAEVLTDPDEDAIERMIFSEHFVAQVLPVLKKEDRELISRRYGLGDRQYTFKELKAYSGLSTDRLHGRLSEALNELRRRAWMYDGDPREIDYAATPGAAHDYTDVMPTRRALGRASFRLAVTADALPPLRQRPNLQIWQDEAAP